MTDEERQRQMDFIPEQQAKFHSDLEIMKETQAKAQANAEKRFNQLEKAFIELYNFIGDTAKLQRENTEQIAELRAAQRKTDERLNIFITVLERDISSRQNGKTKTSNVQKPTTKKASKKRRQ
jgi:vacuolar-type H+-ATPase subunit I/STV1